MGKRLCINRFGQQLCFTAKIIVSTNGGCDGTGNVKSLKEGKMVFSGVNNVC